MRSKRLIRKRDQRRTKGPADVDITSLLDILVILLVFLLKSYSTSSITINVPKGVKLPTSKSISMNTAGVMVQVSPDTIWVDDEVVLDPEAPETSTLDHGGRRIVALFNKLVEKREGIESNAKSIPGAKKFSGIANLVVDKSVKYTELKRLMYTIAEAGYKQYKFVVLSEEQL